MRRVLIRLSVVVLVIVSLRVALPFVQARRLSKQLISDIETLRARELVREPPIEHPLHDNGFECLRDAIATSPADLTPFVHDTSLDVGPWVRGEAPIDTLPSRARERIAQLASWSEGLRGCSSSRMLRFVPGLEPWDDARPVTRVLNAFGALTALEVQTLLAANRPDDALARCVESVELFADASRSSFLVGIVAQRRAEMLVSHCARAFADASVEARSRMAPRMEALPQRAASWPEGLELMRVTEGRYSAAIAGHDEFPEPDTDPPLTRLDRYIMLSLWSESDALQRQLVAGDASASQRLDALYASWWVPFTVGAPPQYDKLFALLDPRRQRLELLPWIAGGAHCAPPCCARVDGGVEWPTADGGVEFLPISAP